MLFEYLLYQLFTFVRSRQIPVLRNLWFLTHVAGYFMVDTLIQSAAKFEDGRVTSSAGQWHTWRALRKPTQCIAHSCAILIC